MTQLEQIREVIRDYVKEKGTDTILERQALYELVNSKYPMNNSSFIPSDFCYNRTNDSIDFVKHVHLYEKLPQKKYRILGEAYPYTGPVFAKRKGDSEEHQSGYWNNGIYYDPMTIEKKDSIRFKNLHDALQRKVQTNEIKIEIRGDEILVSNQENTLCVIADKNEYFVISTPILSWAKQTKYLFSIDDEICSYTVDELDPCVDQVKRLIEYVLSVNNKNKDSSDEQTFLTTFDLNNTGIQNPGYVSY